MLAWIVLLLNWEELAYEIGDSHGQKSDSEVTDHGIFNGCLSQFCTSIAGSQEGKSYNKDGRWNPIGSRKQNDGQHRENCTYGKG